MAELPTICSAQHILHATDKVTVGDVLFLTPEVPKRVDAILDALRTAELGPVLPPDDHGLTPLLAVHSEDYIAYLSTAFEAYAADQGSPRAVMSSRAGVEPSRMATRPSGFPALIDYYTYDYEDPILAGTWEAAYWSVQAALTAAMIVRDARVPDRAGDKPSPAAAYALCRPPGHHAERDRYGGFCYLNNAAIAARWLSNSGRVAVLDVDYHHGNGTQAIFYSDPSVCYVSLHADPDFDYPYHWGRPEEIGEGPGKGTNVNLPLPIGADDEAYLGAVDLAVAALRSVCPDYLVISMGLDAVVGDPIGKFRLSPEGWREAGARIARLALPTTIIQEGGYAVDQLGRDALGFLSSFV